MLAHLAGKKHIQVLKSMTMCMKDMCRWMKEFLNHNRHDIWTPQPEAKAARVEQQQLSKSLQGQPSGYNEKQAKKHPETMSKPAEKEPESPSQSEKKTAETEKDQTVIEQASGDTALSLFDLDDPHMKFLHEVLEGILSLSSYKNIKDKASIDAATQKKIADTQIAMVKKMCTTNGHLTISIARRVTEKEDKDKILEYYPEVKPPLVDLIAGLKPDILALIAGTPLLDSPPV